MEKQLRIPFVLIIEHFTQNMHSFETSIVFVGTSICKFVGVYRLLLVVFDILLHFKRVS